MRFELSSFILLELLLMLWASKETAVCRLLEEDEMLRLGVLILHL